MVSSPAVRSALPGQTPVFTTFVFACGHPATPGAYFNRPHENLSVARVAPLRRVRVEPAVVKRHRFVLSLGSINAPNGKSAHRHLAGRHATFGAQAFDLLAGVLSAPSPPRLAGVCQRLPIPLVAARRKKVTGLI